MSETVPHGVPQGAVCANHVESPAIATCQRCGTFLCSSCLVTGPHGNLCVACAPKIGRTPWEDRARIGFFQAWLQTAKGTLLDPSAFFRLEPVDMGYGSAILWAMLNAFVGGFFALVWGLVQSAIGMSLSSQNPMLGKVLGAGGENIVFQVAGFLLAPLIIVVTLFILSWISHAFLAMFGGANRSFDTTFRTLAYCSTTQLFQVVPVLGMMVAVVWNVVIEIQGLAAAHGTSTGKAAAAVLVPFCLLVGCAAGLMFALFYMLGETFAPGW